MAIVGSGFLGILCMCVMRRVIRRNGNVSRWLMQCSRCGRRRRFSHFPRTLLRFGLLQFRLTRWLGLATQLARPLPPGNFRGLALGRRRGHRHRRHGWGNGL